MTRLKIETFKNALTGSFGVQAVIAKTCGVERSTITKFLNKNPKMRVLLEEEQERIIDVAENKLHAAIGDRDMKAIKFFLQTKGRKRGYQNTQSIEIEGNVSNLSKEEREAEIKRLLGK